MTQTLEDRQIALCRCRWWRPTFLWSVRHGSRSPANGSQWRNRRQIPVYRTRIQATRASPRRGGPWGISDVTKGTGVLS